MGSRERDHQVTTPAVTSDATTVTGYQIRRNAGVEGLLREDGSVVIPAAVAGEVLRALVRDLTARVRADGGEVPPSVRRVLHALHESAVRADAEEPPPAVTGRPVVRSGNVSVAEAATLLECSPRHVRDLIRAGRLPAQRVGVRVWAVDPAALDNYRFGRTAA